MTIPLTSLDRLNIVIDASPISFSSGRGFRRYVLSLLYALANSPEQDRYLILSSDKETPKKLLQDKGRFQWEHPRRRIPMLHRSGVGRFGSLFLGEANLVHFPCSDIWYSPRGKAIVTIHDLAPLHFPERFFKIRKEEDRYRFHLDKIVTYANLIVVDSQHTRQDVLTHLQVPAEKVVTVYAAIDPLFLQKADSFSDAAVRLNGIEGPYFLFVGTLDFRKNIPLLLEAFSLYRDRGGAANLVLVGRQNSENPIYYPPLQPLLESMKEKNHVFWLRDVRDEILPQIYSQSIALILPSLFEGFGYPLIEAMACGTPVIAARTSSLPEIAGEAAVFVELTPDEIAKAMFAIERNDVLREQLITLGKKRLEDFLPHRLAKEMIAIYHKVAEA